MDRVLSDEEKLRHAIEISQRRNGDAYHKQTTRMNINDKKDYKLFKKMILQIIICLFIYGIFYFTYTTNYVFSEEFVKNTQSILNYDVNLEEWYQNCYQFLNQVFSNNQTIEENKIENILSAKSQTKETNEITLTNVLSKEENTVEIIPQNIAQSNNRIERTDVDEKLASQSKEQMEKDAKSVKKLCKFKKPLKGKITSEFGDREVTLQGMTADHKGIDIAANKGTNISAAMTGTVSVAGSNSEYGKFVKIVNGDVMTVYAHCSSLKVKKGDRVKLGQTIAKVGTTGVSTGPHLHFEVRYKNRYINPRLIINF